MIWVKQLVFEFVASTKYTSIFVYHMYEIPSLQCWGLTSHLSNTMFDLLKHCSSQTPWWPWLKGSSWSRTLFAEFDLLIAACFSRTRLEWILKCPWSLRETYWNPMFTREIWKFGARMLNSWPQVSIRSHFLADVHRGTYNPGQAVILVLQHRIQMYLVE